MGAGELDDHLGGFPRRPGALAAPIGQGTATLDELEGEIGRQAVVLAVTSKTCTMPGCLSWAIAWASVRNRTSCSREAWTPARTILRRDVAVEAELACLIDHAHAAAAQLLHELISERAGGLGRRASAGRPRREALERLGV